MFYQKHLVPWLPFATPITLYLVSDHCSFLNAQPDLLALILRIMVNTDSSTYGGKK